MTVRATWDDTTKPILLVYIGAWTWDEVEAERAPLLEKILASQLRAVAMIHDFAAQTTYPLDVLVRGRSMFNRTQETHTVTHIFIISNPTMLTMTQVFRRLLPVETQERFKVARDYDEAMAMGLLIHLQQPASNAPLI